MLYEIKLSVPKIDDKGCDKTAKEHYILEAENHGDAERIGYEIYPDTAMDVFAVFRSDVREIINLPSDGEYTYKAIVVDTFVDDNGKEKDIKYPMLVFANNLNDAVERMNEHLRQGYDMTLDSIRRVKILDYINRL